MGNAGGKITGMRRAWKTASLLAAGLLLSAACAVKASEIPLEQRTLFYDYVTYELLPTYGYADRASTETEVDRGSLNSSTGDGYCQDGRTGLISANVLDMNDDGSPELLVTMLAKDKEISYGSKHPVAAYACLFGLDGDEVKHISTVKLMDDNNLNFLRFNAGFMDIGGVHCFATESVSNAYLGDNAGALFHYFCFDGSSLRQLYIIGKTDGGSTDIAYKLKKKRDDGKTQVKLLWADGGYLAAEGGTPVVSEDEGSPGEGMEAGFALLKLAEPARVMYENSGWSLYYDSGDLYPSYYGTDEMEEAFSYRASGWKDEDTLHMTVSLEDRTELKRHFEKRNTDWEHYIKRGGQSAQSAGSGQNLQGSQSFADSADAKQIFPDSWQRALGEDDVRGKSWEDLRQGINEIYARRGYTFKTPEILAFFRKFDWYEEKYADQNVVYTDVLSSVERQNVDFLNKYVERKTPPGTAG